MTNIKKQMDRYIEAAINYGIALEEGNANQANKHGAIIRRIRRNLQKDSTEFLECFGPLLYHQNDYVRLKVAFDLLPVLTESTEKVLYEISQKRGLVALEAETLLEEWKKGNL